MQIEELALAALRARLLKMDDAELERFGKASAYMCSPEANFGEPPPRKSVLQREEARAEWRRRHPRAEQ